MKKFGLVMLISTVTLGCDPVSIMDANITNSTSQELTVVFASSTVENRALQIPANETIRFQESQSTTGSFLEPYLVDYDSVYIQNDSDEILIVYQPDSPGKNIYNVSTDWSFDEPSKRSYKYEYEIVTEDLN